MKETKKKLKELEYKMHQIYLLKFFAKSQKEGADCRKLQELLNLQLVKIVEQIEQKPS